MEKHIQQLTREEKFENLNSCAQRQRYFSAFAATSKDGYIHSLRP